MMVAEKCKILDFENKTFIDGYTVREVIPAEEYPAYCEKLGYVPELKEPDTDFHLNLSDEEVTYVRYALWVYQSHCIDKIRSASIVNQTMLKWYIEGIVILERILRSFPSIEEVEQCQ